MVRRGLEMGRREQAQRTGGTAAKRPVAAALPGPGEAAFPVVGLGASAGGLEALGDFLSHLPENPGAALLVVQHLDPRRPGILPELLQRSTRLGVREARDRQELRPNEVYVIPPGKDLTLSGGRLRLADPPGGPAQHRPIDLLFRSLAAELGPRAVGIVLSGMGSDGAQGLRAILDQGGLTLVQDPATALFDSMPLSAIQEGSPHLVAAPATLAEALLDQLTRTRHVPPGPLPAEPPPSVLETVCALLRAHTGHDFSRYKKTTVYRRIERRMGIHACPSIADYARHLAGNPQEVDLLFKELLIGVTSFFRDPEAWQQLSEEVLPALLAAHPGGGGFRAWVAGCSTGEEAYSLAMAFKEVQERLRPAVPCTLQIFATDLDLDAIEKARQGLFSAQAVEGLSPDRLSAWFRPDGEGYRVRKELREMLVFAPQDVNLDPPFIKLDLLLCRNLLIYLSPELQKQLLPLFHFCLKPGGVLFLGSAESIGSFSDLFAPLPGKARLYQRQETSPASGRALFPITPPLPRETLREPPMPTPTGNLQMLAEQALLQRYAPPAVLASRSGDILYISGRTGKYLEPAVGKANWNVFAMAREGLQVDLTVAFRKALGQAEPVVVRALRVETNGGPQLIDLTVQALATPEALQGLVLVVFSDLPAAEAARPAPRRKGAPVAEVRLLDLERELAAAMDELRSAREEMETSQEELKATNEELQSTNEELQSTNEELTTSKEELQSMNEELQTVNAEQQARVDELSATNNDMKNLLDATDIATLFLDESLNIRRFTHGATRLFKLIPGDVGRPLTDIATDLDYPDLIPDAREVLRTLAYCEKELPALQGSWFTVRILPYRTVENAIGGVVLTFFDITRAKVLETKLRQAAR